MSALASSLYPQIVSAVFGLIGTITAALIGKEFINRKRLQEKLLIAQRDIAFLLEVEAAHCAKHKELCHASFKTRIRKEVLESGHSWSGRFTPGRLRGNTAAAPITTTVAAHAIVLFKGAASTTAHVLAAAAKYLVAFAVRRIAKRNSTAKTA